MFIWLTSITNWIISTSIADGIIGIVFNILAPILLPIADGIIGVVFNILTPILLPIAFLLIVD